MLSLSQYILGMSNYLPLCLHVLNLTDYNILQTLQWFVDFNCGVDIE